MFVHVILQQVYTILFEPYNLGTMTACSIIYKIYTVVSDKSILNRKQTFRVSSLFQYIS